MSRIVVIDLLFHWPPDGGAKIDLVEVLTRLSFQFDIHLVVPYYKKYYNRGGITKQFPFRVHKLPLSDGQYNLYYLPNLIENYVKSLCPDVVWIADGDALKPYIAERLLNFPLLYRFYSYETLCLRSYGTRYNNEPCKRCSTIDTPLKCTICGLFDAIKRKDKFHEEALRGAETHTGKYRNALIQSLKNSAAVIVSNSSFAKEIRNLTSNVVMIPGGINIQEFARGKPRYKYPTDIVVGMPGRVDDYIKGFNVLLSATKMLINQGKNIRILITSNKNYSKYPFVENLGWVPFDKMADFYSMIDMCVVPSLWEEPFGLVAIEAMAAGKPVIVSDKGGLIDIVRNGVNGIIVPSGSVPDLADRIKYLYDSPTVRASLGQEAQKTVKYYYQWDTIIKNHYIPLLEGILGVRHGIPKNTFL